tara:strand:- start:615 stop:1784 length:1170 start_codon:yes stop_codon:yes gene_type:complete
MIPYSKQNLDKEDINAVLEVLNSDYLTQGPRTPIFEKELITKFKSKYAIAVNNATNALHLACLSLGVKKGDRVWTSTTTFVASANCAKYCNAEIDLVDIDINTFNISIEALEQKLISAKKKNKLPKVLIPVHLAGNPCDMKRIHDLSIKYGFKIIEDASHACGSIYNGEIIGNCKYSDITVFSFHPVKMITTAEGGACMTNNQAIFEKIYNLRSHGIIRSNYRNPDDSHGPWYYEMTELGFNYRLNDILASLGSSQLKKLDSFVLKRNELAKRYKTKFDKIKFIDYQKVENINTCSYHLFIIKVDKNHDESRLTIFEKLRREGFFVNVHYIPIYKHPYYSNLFDKNQFPNTEDYYSSCISIPIFPNLSNKNINKIYDIITTKKGFQEIF